MGAGAPRHKRALRPFAQLIATMAMDPPTNLTVNGIAHASPIKDLRDLNGMFVCGHSEPSTQTSRQLIGLRAGLRSELRRLVPLTDDGARIAPLTLAAPRVRRARRRAGMRAAVLTATVLVTAVAAAGAAVAGCS